MFTEDMLALTQRDAHSALRPVVSKKGLSVLMSSDDLIF